ncbi:MAG: hypothetical protein ACTHW2_01900 [Tissierella sp.]|uniref:hypothetical protein n=1 Tax=Tissierella sp. TaxID=41274 RepID=UPI003F9B2290
MDIMLFLPILSFALFGFAVIGLLYSFIKKKDKKLWIGLFILSFILPFVLLITFVDKKETAIKKYDDTGKPIFHEPVINDSGDVNLKEGEYLVDENIPSGTYDLKIDAKFGEVFVNGVEPTYSIWQRLGISGIEDVRIELKKGYELRVSDDAILTLSEKEKFEYKELELYPGIWYVGKDITSGRYTILPTTDTIGEVKIYEKDSNIPVADGKLGKF